MIIKFGGSMITHKAKKGIYNSNATRRLLIDLRKYYDEFVTQDKKGKSAKTKSGRITEKKMDDADGDYDLILVHGAGSFGHISSRKYRLDKGYLDKKQLIGLTEVYNDVRDLNLKFMNELLLTGFHEISIPPLTILRNHAKIVSCLNSEIFRKVLNMHCIPVTFGDVVPDDSMGFSICSGDSIIQKLSGIYKPYRVIFLTDVDGLFTDNPILNPKAELIQELTHESFSSACTSENANPDVTGGIHLKGKIALALRDNGVTTYITNGNVPGRLGSALRNEAVTGTICKGNLKLRTP